MKKIIWFLFWWTWGFVPSFSGLVCFLYYKAKGFTITRSAHPHNAGGVVLKRGRKNNAFSLGYFIFMSKSDQYGIWKHEGGHVIQAMILGPLYILIMIASGIHFLAQEKYKWLKVTDKYYDFITESLADKMAWLWIKLGSE